ncbi:MAG: ABC transporter ATP-binding protein [Pseudomonadota bacterium]
MARITLDGVTKRYGGVTALDDVSLDIEDGSFASIFGPPGSGKSVLLRLLLGLEPVDAGRILIDGRDVTALPPQSRDIAMVFQNLALFPHLTARDNIAFPLRRRGTDKPEIARRIEAVSDVIGIDHILHKRPAALSGGERQRVAIARALVRDASAYLMDEPIAALDARLRDTMRVELKRLQTELGHTFIYVTHDNEEAMSVADRLAILDRGRLVQVGMPDAIYAAPDTLAVAELVGSPRINRLAVRREAGRLVGPLGALSIAPPKGPDDCILAVRPEAVSVTPDGASEIRVTDVERLGGFAIVTVRGGGEEVRAIMAGDAPIDIGHQVALAFDPSGMHLFTPDGARP